MLNETTVWAEARRMPAAITGTLAAIERIGPALDLLTNGQFRRVVVTGNGASLHAALVLWQIAHGGPAKMQVDWVHAGHLADHTVPLAADDLLIAVSTSGELRDVITVLRRPNPPTTVAVTAHPQSSIGTHAQLVLPLTVYRQHAITHTQAYASATTACIFVGAWLREDLQPDQLLQDAAAEMETALDRAESWVETAAAQANTTSRTALSLGSGWRWPGALQAGLMLKEIAGIPTESGEAREIVTSSRCACAPEDLVLASDNGDADTDEIVHSLETTGASIVRLPQVQHHAELSSLTQFPAPLALAIRLAQMRGINPDQPSWYAEYLNLARAKT